MDHDRATLDDWNRAARAGTVSETLFGQEVADPYRSLESDTPETRHWIDAQTARTERALAKVASAERSRRLEEFLSIGAITQPSIGGDRVFYLMREGEREQPALFVIERSGLPNPLPLVDPTTLGERVALDWYQPSPSGRLVAYGISENGDERSTLHVVEVSSGHVLPDAIPHTKWSTISWLGSERGFYYTRYPKAGEPNYDANQEDTYFPRVYFHSMGSNPDTDQLVFGGERGTDFPGADVSADDRWVVINVFRGWSASDVYLIDRAEAAAALRVDRAAPPPLHPVVVGRENLTTGRMHRGKLYLLTNIDAPRYRLAVVEPRHAQELERWSDVIPQGQSAIEDYEIASDRIVVHYIDDVRSVLKTFRLGGGALGDIELPNRGLVDGLAGQLEGRLVVFGWSSFFYPPRLMKVDTRTGHLELLKDVASDIDVEAYELTQERVPSADGTPINVYLVHRRGLELGGHNPVLLNGYGGFNISLLPNFTRHALYWIEKGGVYAVANLRGGGEFGEEWHRAGNLENKAHVFQDFEAVVRWLGHSGWSEPSRIAITGGSNGGLLMGALITRAPDAFAAATTYVGLYDMLRYDRFPPAELWVSEYGSASNERQFRYLLEYSPYHRIVDGTPYPAVLVETADHDSRVYWGHSTKFAARLQQAQASERPIYFYRENQVGHGAGTRLTDLVRRYSRAYSFLEAQLGISSH